MLLRLDDCKEDAGLGPGILAASPTLTSEPFYLDVEVPITGAPEHKLKSIKVKATRQQVPLVIENASTLYTLQGATADPGLTFYWCFPAKLSSEMRWLTVYMALSQVRSLAQFWSIGFKDTVKTLINGGPPSGIISHFALLFDEKAASTDLPADEAMSELGW